MIIETLPHPVQGGGGGGCEVIHLIVSITENMWSALDNGYGYDYTNANILSTDILILTPCTDPLQFGNDSEAMRASVDAIARGRVYITKLSYDDQTLEDGIIAFDSTFDIVDGQGDIPTTKYDLVIIRPQNNS